MKHLHWKAFAVVALLWSNALTWAEAPAGYYDSAKGKNKAALLSALNKIVGSHTAVSYNGLWNVYKSSDVTAEGYIWDMYSTAKFTPGKNQCGSYTTIGSCYNREHSFPKSWFNDATPMVSDAYHIYPTDGKVNGQRSNYPYGECANGVYLASNGSVKALGKLGTCTFPGYSGKVFEPDDEYKGDFARTYFYMAATYNTRISSWQSDMLSNNSYPCFSTWAINLLLKWNREDPVSSKETARNEVVSSYQKNRNPFIDHPELAEYIWGNQMSGSWEPGGAVLPSIVSPTQGTVYDCGVTSIGKTVSITIPVRAVNLTEELLLEVTGNYFSVTPSSVTQEQANVGTTVTVRYMPTAVGKHSATLAIGNGELQSSVVLNGEAVDGIPAQEATDVTSSSFVANWQDVDNGSAEYALSVFDADATTLHDGYPVNVRSSLEAYKVTGLDYSTDYYYQLSNGSQKSNKIKVTTDDPDRVLAIIAPTGGFNMVAQPNESSNIIEGSVYTEYINETITATVSGNFQLSKNKSDWSSSVDIDAEGETFYIRIADTSSEGEFTGDISLSTPTFDGEDMTVTGVVSYPRSFIEDFEEMVTSGYETAKDVQGTACTWNLVLAGAYGRSGDRYNGTQCLCTGKSGNRSFTMAEDKLLGAGTLTFYAAPYAGDGLATLDVSYSVDGGSTWTLAQSYDIDETVLTQHVLDLKIQGAVRLKFEQKSGKRLCVDDIALTDFVGTGVAEVNEKPWCAYAVGGGLALAADRDTSFEVYSMDAVMVNQANNVNGTKLVKLPKGVYVVVSGNDAQKVIVK